MSTITIQFVSHDRSVLTVKVTFCDCNGQEITQQIDILLSLNSAPEPSIWIVQSDLESTKQLPTDVEDELVRGIRENLLPDIQSKLLPPSDATLH